MIELRPIGVEQYSERHTKPMSVFHEKLWLETYRKTGNAATIVGPLEGQFLKMLVLMTGARRILEIGMFTGYSTLAFAEALPKGGHIVSCEINPQTTEIARRCFSESPHGSKIEVRVGPAVEALRVITGPFDLCFIDADKENYGTYYDLCLQRARPKGLIVLDHMLAEGRVLNPSDPVGKAMDDLNKRIRQDSRVENVLLPLGDGMMMVVKV
ncbi:MAG TPA: class I SAM-dependent methyltransferase [Terriglobales bacterium]|nr:class I SAM-dependent methyltransferase [Terriglobales bacterium]